MQDLLNFLRSLSLGQNRMICAGAVGANPARIAGIPASP